MLWSMRIDAASFDAIRAVASCARMVDTCRRPCDESGSGQLAHTVHVDAAPDGGSRHLICHSTDNTFPCLRMFNVIYKKRIIRPLRGRSRSWSKAGGVLTPRQASGSSAAANGPGSWVLERTAARPCRPRQQRELFLDFRSHGNNVRLCANVGCRGC